MVLDKKIILLIDDDMLINKVNEEIVKSTEVFNTIIVKSDSSQIISYITTCMENKLSIPGVIFIDISMPIYDGFELIDEIEEFFEANDIDELPTIILLSSSQYKGDFERFTHNPTIKKFLTKPLKKDELVNLLEELNLM